MVIYFVSSYSKQALFWLTLVTSVSGSFNMGEFYYMLEIPNNEEFNKTLMGKIYCMLS